MSLRERLGIFVAGGGAAVEIPERLMNLPGWSLDVITHVLKAQRQLKGSRDAELQTLWQALPVCSIVCSEQDPQLGEGTYGTIQQTGGQVYKQLRVMSMEEREKWFRLVIEALIQAVVHQAVPFATPDATVCKGRQGRVGDERLIMLTSQLDDTVRRKCSASLDGCSLLELLDLMAQMIMIYIGILDAGLSFSHNDLHVSNIMYKQVDEPVTLTVGAVTYRSLTHSHWMLIDFGRACLYDNARSFTLYAKKPGDACYANEDDLPSIIEEVFSVVNKQMQLRLREKKQLKPGNVATRQLFDFVESVYSLRRRDINIPDLVRVLRDIESEIEKEEEEERAGKGGRRRSRSPRSRGGVSQ
jgi:hypothetical protein